MTHHVSHGRHAEIILPHTFGYALILGLACASWVGVVWLVRLVV